MQPLASTSAPGLISMLANDVLSHFEAEMIKLQLNVTRKEQQLEVYSLYEVLKVTRFPHLHDLLYSGLCKTSGVGARSDVKFMKSC